MNRVPYHNDVHVAIFGSCASGDLTLAEKWSTGINGSVLAMKPK